MKVLLCVQGAFWGLMVGLAVGVTRMVLEFAFPPPRCGVFDPAPPVLRSVHYLHFAIILCAITVVVTVAVSLLTPAPSDEQVTRSKTAGRVLISPDDITRDGLSSGVGNCLV